MSSDPLYIGNEMAAFDRKDRKYYDKFTDEQLKKFSTYLMLRWGASVSGNADLQAYYLIATNERVNKNFFDLNKHPKLQWLLCTTVSPGMGKQHHNWLAAKKKDGPSGKLQKFVTNLYPEMKQDEIDLFLKLNDLKSLKQLAKDLGIADKDINKEL